MTGALVRELLSASLTSVVDVGAAAMDGPAPYAGMLAAELCTVLGFEPQPDELARLNARKSVLEHYQPDAIGCAGAGSLNICAAPGMTSLLDPNPFALDAFPPFYEWGKVVCTEKIELVRLDDACGGRRVDFLKIDAQGSELDIMMSGPDALAQAAAVQLEVSFVPLYRDQPTLGTIDLFMRSNGFLPHRFAAIKSWCVTPVKTPQGSQLLEADLVYVRDFTKMHAMTDRQVVQMVMICHCIYGSFDLAARCVQEFQKRSGKAGLLAKYIEIVRSAASRGI